MRVGVDGRKIPEADERGPLASLEHGRQLGMDGLFFRTVLEMSPRLDRGELREIRQRADELGMYLETGLGKVNPYATPETPELRRAGDGDILLGFERMLRACAEIDCRELWVGTANYKSEYRGNLCYDRFRTDVSWADQLVATEKFLRKLAPIARDLGIHMNLETHEEITSFECVRLVEAVGPDALGIVFDTANVLQRGEHPTDAARRVAPYVRQTHVKDTLLYFVDEGVNRQPRPCGQGVIDFRAVLPILAAARPDLNLSIENPTSHMPLQTIPVFDPAWAPAHPDLPVDELAAWFQLVKECEWRIERGEVEDARAHLARPFGYAEAVAYIAQSAAHVRGIIAELGLAA
jgi:sugar phosphate isomerase/epimerase